MAALLHMVEYSLFLGGEGLQRPLLDQISLEVRPAEVVALVGPSGSGKSMMLRAIVQLLGSLEAFSQEGSINFAVDQHEVFDLIDYDDLTTVRRSHIGMIFQQSSKILNPSQTIKTQLKEKILKNSVGDQNQYVAVLLEEVELKPADLYMDAFPHQLSGGQIQRVLIAMALVNDPRLLLADEPFSALDHDTKSNLRSLFQKLTKERKLALLLVTHDEGIVDQLAHRKVYLKSGKIVEESQPAVVQFSRSARSHSNNLLMSVSQLTKRFGASGRALGQSEKSGKLIFDAFDLNIYRGECLGIYGDSGSGKSTLARMMMGLEPYEAGSISYGGRKFSETNKAQWKSFRRSAQIIFQDPLSSMPPHRKVRQLYSDAFYVMGDKFDKDKVMAVWKMLGLDAVLLERRPMQLSGGQRQRILIGRALLLGVEFLVCDEIFASLDRNIGDQILEHLMVLQQEKGLTLVLVSHDKETLERCCNRLIKL